MDYWKYVQLRDLLYIWCGIAGDLTTTRTWLTLILGTFWLVQGGGLMPFFASGMNYSPTGNSFEGQQTGEYAATIGTYLYSIHIPDIEDG